MSAVFWPDGRFFVTGDSDGMARIWDRATFKQVGSGLRHTEGVRRAEFSPDGRFLLTAGREGTVSIWEFARDDLAAFARGKIDEDHASHDPWPGRAGMKTQRWGFDRDGSDAIAPTGDLAVQQCDGLVRLLDARSGQPVGRPILARWPSFTTVAFSPDGRRVAIPSIDNGIAPDRSIWSACQVWDTTTGRPVSPLLPHQNWPAGLAFSPDGKTLAVGDYAGSVSLWEVEAGRLVGGRRLPVGAITINVAFSPNGRFLAAAGAEFAFQVVLWDREAPGALGKSFPFADYVFSLAFSYEQRPDNALRLLDRVVAERPGDWLSYALRADVHAYKGDTIARDADIDRAVARDAEVQFLLRIAYERAYAGRWAEAARLYDRAIAQGPVPYDVWMQAAIAHVEVDDGPGHRRVCETLLKRQPGDALEPFVTYLFANLTTLAPGGTGGDERALGWVRDLPGRVSNNPGFKRSVLLTKGGVLHRMGFEFEAIAALGEAVALGGGQPTPEESFFLAMAHERSGDHARARALLRGVRGEDPPIEHRELWWSARARHLLRREAARLILDRDMPADPFAR